MGMGSPFHFFLYFSFLKLLTVASVFPTVGVRKGMEGGRWKRRRKVLISLELLLDDSGLSGPGRGLHPFFIFWALWLSSCVPLSAILMIQANSLLHVIVPHCPPQLQFIFWRNTSYRLPVGVTCFLEKLFGARFLFDSPMQTFLPWILHLVPSIHVPFTCQWWR